MTFFKRTSLPLGLTVLTVLCGSLSAQAETGLTAPDATANLETSLQTSDVAAPTTSATDEAELSLSAPSTTVKFTSLDRPSEQLLADHAPGHSATTPDTAVPAAEPTTTVPAEAVEPATFSDTANFAPESTEATDLVPAEATAETVEAEPTSAERPQVAQVPTSPVLRRPPGNNYIGAGVNFGDDTSFAVISKFALTQFSSYGLSLRPTALINNDSVDFRVPITVEAQLNTDVDTVNRLIPYAGLGVAVNTEDDTNVDFMLTAGSDFLLTSRFTATAGLNLLFSDDSDLELLLGVGYNF